jgi:Tol biopolymer transport system component
VLFLSNATNLVAGVAFTHSSTNLYWRDLQTGSTRLVSADAAGTGDADQGVLDGVFSSDGRYVAFTSLATNLTAQATNGFCNVFFRDMQGGGTRLLSVNQAGTGGGGDSGLTYTQEGLSISADGRYVAFSSTALDLVAGTTQTGNVFVRDTVANATRLVTLNAAGTQDVGRSGNPVLSADGRFVAFFSDATNLVAGLTTHFGGNVFLRDLQTNTTQLVSINAAGTDGNDVDNQTYDAFNGPSLAISADGRFVAFRDRATDLVANFQGPGLGNAYVRDTQTGTTILVSRNVAGTGGLAGQATSPFNDNAGDIVLSADGSWVGFDTPLANLYLGDTNRAYDVYGSTISVGTAAVRGQVFSDANGNGARDAGESGRAGMLVYLDADGNGRLDPGEVTAQTDAGGNYAFTGLTAGTYLVRQSLPANFQQTLPGGGAGIPVTLANGQNLTGQDFGDEILTPDLAVTTASADPAGSAGRPLALTWTGRTRFTSRPSPPWTPAPRS